MGSAQLGKKLLSDKKDSGTLLRIKNGKRNFTTQNNSTLTDKLPAISVGGGSPSPQDFKQKRFLEEESFSPAKHQSNLSNVSSKNIRNSSIALKKEKLPIKKAHIQSQILDVQRSSQVSLQNLKKQNIIIRNS